MQDGKRRKRNREVEIEGLPVVRANVAGIDLGSESHWVCAPRADGGRDVEQFGATTPELERLAKWLKDRNVESVAMESTGVYWIAAYEVLEQHGLEVVLANTRELSRVPGRKKTDRIDCKWIQRLHSCGLVIGSFRPKEQICMLRTLVRDKANLVAESGDWLRRMQKSLDQMNVRVHRAVADINGLTGMAILRAIVAGERDPRQLAKFRHPNCHKSEEEIAEELSGHWREDHLFSLQQGLKMYDAIQERIAAYDRELLRKLAEMQREDCQGQEPPKLTAQKARTIRRRGQEAMRQALYRMSGVDLTGIDAIGVETVQVVLSEYGPDLSRFPTEKQFISHITLAPRKAMSGGKQINQKKKRGSASSRVAASLRMAAVSLRHSNTALGAYYRQVARRTGADVAVFATARKLATLIYRLLRWGQPYVDEGAQAFENRHRLSRIKRLTAMAKDLGFQVQPQPSLTRVTD